MGSISNKLNYALTSKELIRQAIQKGGVGCSTNVPFRQYADKILEIKKASATEWVRAEGAMDLDLIASKLEGRFVLETYDTNNLSNNMERYLTMYSSYANTYLVRSVDEEGNVVLEEYNDDKPFPYMNKGYITVVKYPASGNYSLQYMSSNGNRNLMRTYMYEAYVNCEGLNSNYLNSMFANCYSLQRVHICGNDLVTSIALIFKDCYNLSHIVLEGMKNVTTINESFHYCYSLKDLKLDSFAGVKYASYAFSSCSSLVSLDLSSMSSLTDMANMFEHCRSLRTIQLPDLSNVTGLYSTFSYCPSLQEVNLNTAINAKDISYAIRECKSLRELDISNLNNVTGLSWFAGTCGSLLSVKLGDLSNVTSVSAMFSNCLLVDFEVVKLPALNITIPSTYLTYDSVMNIINALPETESTLTLSLGSTGKSKLSEDEIAIATNKGWTVA